MAGMGRVAKMLGNLGTGAKKAGGASKGRIAESFKKHPIMSTVATAGIGLPVANWGLDLGEDIGDSFTGNDDVERRKLAVEQMLAEMRQGGQQDQLQMLIAQNTQKLMQQAPELAASLMAGRRLPPGAAMFGQQPRADLLEEVAAHMAQGGFAPGGDDPAGDFLGM